MPSELDFTFGASKPIVVVHEEDVHHGGLPLEILQEECNAKRPEFSPKIFDAPGGQGDNV